MFSHYNVHTFGLENVFKPIFFAGSSLCVFFVLSGFLVGQSVLRNSRKTFLKKRVLRLYPVYLCTLFFSIIAVFIFEERVEIFKCLRWFGGELFFKGKELYGVSNGVTWAIFVQIQVYIAAMFFYPVLNKIKKIEIWLMILFVLLMLNLLYGYINEFFCNVGFNFYSITFFPYAYFFFLGIIVFQFFNRIVPFLVKYCWLFLVVHLVWHLHLIPFPKIYLYTDPITVVTAAAAAIGFAYKKPYFSKIKDLSYDIFIWHMPIYTFINSYTAFAGWAKILICLVLTFFFSYLTHRFVERVA